MALGRVSLLAGRMPLSCPSPVDSPGACSARTGAADAAVPLPAATASDGPRPPPPRARQSARVSWPALV